MKQYQGFVTVVHIFLTLTSTFSDAWKLFKKTENVDGQICKDVDRVFNKIQIFDISACVLECVNHFGCKKVFHGQNTGDCIGCIAGDHYINFSLDLEDGGLPFEDGGLIDDFKYFWESSKFNVKYVQ